MVDINKIQKQTKSTRGNNIKELERQIDFYITYASENGHSSCSTHIFKFEYSKPDVLNLLDQYKRNGFSTKIVELSGALVSIVIEWEEF